MKDSENSIAVKKLLDILDKLDREKFQGPVTLHLAAGSLKVIEYKHTEKLTV